jgi:hypothetical protein
MIDFTFQIFGSASSLDIDAIVFVNAIEDNPFTGIEECKKYNKQIGEYLNTDKKINANLAILENGNIKKVLKGTSDEVNNSMFTTYHLHTQSFPNQVMSMVIRDLDLKVLRTARVLLSLLSRTQYREMVKIALKKDFDSRIEALGVCDVSVINKDNLGSKNESFADFVKSYAFQIGQTLALMDGKEIYTKEEVSLSFPELHPYISRDVSQDLTVMELWKNEFVEQSKKIKLKTLIEYKI